MNLVNNMNICVLWSNFLFFRLDNYMCLYLKKLLCFGDIKF